MAAETEEAALMSLSATGAYMRVPNRNYFVACYDRSPGIVLMGGVTANGLSKLGWSMQKVKEFLWEKSKMSREEIMAGGCGFTERKPKSPDEYDCDPMPITSKAERITVVIAGGESSRITTGCRWVSGRNGR